MITPHNDDAPIVWAALLPDRITIGEDESDEHFESWERDVSDDEVAAEAVEYFRDLLQKHHYL